MKSIDRKDFIGIGTVARTHGTRGEIRLELQRSEQFKEWAFLEIQGKPVPFYVESVFGSEDAPILKLKGINTPDDALRLNGLTVLIQGKERKAKGLEDTALIGYKLIDETAGEIGFLEELVEMPQQLFLQTTRNGREVLIPAVEEFILGIDKKKKEIRLKLPEGLLEI